MTRLKRWWKEIGAFGLLTLFFGLIWRGVSKLVENAVVGWVDNAIGDVAGISGPSIGAVVSFIVDYGPPPAGAALVLLGYHLLVRPKVPKASVPVVEELPEVEDLVRMRSAGRSSLAAEVEDIAQRINLLGARLPLMMPDDPRYAAHGDRNNRMSDDYFMREYRESIETDVQRALGRANARKLLDANDRIYLLHKAAARRAV